MLTNKAMVKDSPKEYIGAELALHESKGPGPNVSLATCFLQEMYASFY
jgi:hypothetical protein